MWDMVVAFFVFDFKITFWNFSVLTMTINRGDPTIS
jgi:hypothetical protein